MACKVAMMIPRHVHNKCHLSILSLFSPKHNIVCILYCINTPMPEASNGGEPPALDRFGRGCFVGIENSFMPLSQTSPSFPLGFGWTLQVQSVYNPFLADAIHHACGWSSSLAMP